MHFISGQVLETHCVCHYLYSSNTNTIPTKELKWTNTAATSHLATCVFVFEGWVILPVLYHETIKKDVSLLF